VISARRLYRLMLALGALGAAVSALALARAVRAVSLETPAVNELARACRSFLLPQVSAGGILVLGLSALGAVVVARGLASLLRHVVREARLRRHVSPGRRAELHGVGVRLVDEPEALAFCSGWVRPSITLSTGALTKLSRAELRAVLAHERHHQRRRDPLRFLVAGVLADALFFVPAVRRASDRYSALAELAADEAALTELGDTRPLASALLRFGEQEPVVVSVAAERVDHLAGDPARWELPSAVLFASLLAIAGVLSLTTLSASVLGAARLDLPLLLAESCMTAMVLLPLVLLVGSLAVGRAWARQRR
jgi:Zn-dependent protease with chaperone function